MTESIDLTTARLASRMQPPLYWREASGGWVAYVGRGIFERGMWDRAGAGWVTLTRIQPREEWA